MPSMSKWKFGYNHNVYIREAGNREVSDPEYGRSVLSLACSSKPAVK